MILQAFLRLGLLIQSEGSTAGLPGSSGSQPGRAFHGSDPWRRREFLVALQPRHRYYFCKLGLAGNAGCFEGPEHGQWF